MERNFFWMFVWTLLAREISHIHHEHILRHGCLVAKTAKIAIVQDVVSTEVTLDELSTIVTATQNIAHDLTNIEFDLVVRNQPLEELATNEIIQLQKLGKWKMQEAKILMNTILHGMPDTRKSVKKNDTSKITS